MRCENLNKGRVIGPCIIRGVVDIDGGAMSDAEFAATPSAIEDGLQILQCQSNNRALMQSVGLAICDP